VEQRIIDLYDAYTHSEMDGGPAMSRRVFLEKLAILAGGTTAAMALMPFLENNYAQAAIIAPGDLRVAITTGSYPAGDVDVAFYEAKPSRPNGPLPGVIVIHENRGLNPHIQDVARRFATEGFVALAVDLLSAVGGTPADENAARGLFGRLGAGVAVAEVQAGLAYLATRGDTNGANGIVGFCWGGGMVNDVASHAETGFLNGAVAYYGAVPSAADVANVRVPLLLHYGGQDSRINGGIPGYTAALDAAGATYTVHIYDGANHAFNNDTNASRYNKAASDLAWTRTVGFFTETLKG
jgi:carboxymethylenebutenolidase